MPGEKGGYVPPDVLGEDAGHQVLDDLGKKYVVPKPAKSEGEARKIIPEPGNPQALPDHTPEKK